MFDIKQVSGIGEYVEGALDVAARGERTEELARTYAVPEGKVFVVVRLNTIEVRCDENLSQLLREKYESVMESRYFGKGGVEIVLSGQLSLDEIDDLVRLSYNLTKTRP